MFDPEFAFDVPTGSSLLAEVGIRPEHVREVAEDDRAIRCPDRGAAYPAYGFASLTPEPPVDQGLYEAAPPDRGPGQAAEPWDPASSFLPADQRWRGARRD